MAHASSTKDGDTPKPYPRTPKWDDFHPVVKPSIVTQISTETVNTAKSPAGTHPLRRVRYRHCATCRADAPISIPNSFKINFAANAKDKTNDSVEVIVGKQKGHFRNATDFVGCSYAAIVYIHERGKCLRIGQHVYVDQSMTPFVVYATDSNSYKATDQEFDVGTKALKFYNANRTSLVLLKSNS